MTKLRGYVVLVKPRRQGAHLRHRHVFGHSEVANSFFQDKSDAIRWLERWEAEFTQFTGRLVVRHAVLRLGHRDE